MPDYLFDEDTCVKSRVEVAIHGRILDVKYTQILMKLSQPESFASCPAGSGAETPELTPAAYKWLKAEKLREGRAPNYYITAKVAEWTGQKARYIGNRGWMISTWFSEKTSIKSAYS